MSRPFFFNTLKNGMIMFLFAIAAANTTYAGENRIEVAVLDKNARLQQPATAVPPLVSEKYEYYEITGSSEKDLRCQMTQNGCTWDDGKKYDSITSWRIKWDYDHTSAPKSCSPDSFKTTVEITFHYPKWVRTENAPGPLVVKWGLYLKNLTKHENGHRDLAVQAAAELSELVSALPPASSCSELDRRIHALSNERMKKLKADEVRYDEITHHGKTQGALFR